MSKSKKKKTKKTFLHCKVALKNAKSPLFYYVKKCQNPKKKGMERGTGGEFVPVDVTRSDALSNIVAGRVSSMPRNN